MVDYSPALGDEICRLIADGLSLSEVCRRDGMPHRQRVHEWVAEDRDGFADKYARASDARLDRWAEELLEISDDAANDWMERNAADNPGWQLNGEHVQRSKLRSDNRKWLLSKLRPDRYGERIAHTGADGKDLLPAAQDSQRLAAVLIAAFTGALPKPEGS